MTKNRVTTPRDWISDYFSPLVTVLASPDAESVVGKNNLSPVELLQPFSKLLSDLTIKDAEGNNHAIHALNVTFQVTRSYHFILVVFYIDLVHTGFQERSVSAGQPQTALRPGGLADRGRDGESCVPPRIVHANAGGARTNTLVRHLDQTLHTFHRRLRPRICQVRENETEQTYIYS